jgi:hypothetical protein
MGWIWKRWVLGFGSQGVSLGRVVFEGMSLVSEKCCCDESAVEEKRVGKGGYEEGRVMGE